ncbi:MAG: hypothetical protein OEZ68_05550 [Gammaproteobacteria bacterium]|nr:hypothetical protein [Gammaproteobacteria bacterium]MDH5800254.1 hypothetical protein [Gammaproteobacteria bacterium]
MLCSTTPIKQNGAVSLITVLLLSTVVVVLLLSTITQSRIGISDSLDERASVAALFLAESGLENAVQRLSSASVACDASLADTFLLSGGTVNIAAGSSTHFDGVTPLSAGECRVNVEATMSSQVTRRIQSIVSFASGGGGIAVTNVGSRERRNQNFTNYNFSVTGPDPFLMVAVVVFTSAGESVTSVTYDGIPVPLFGSIASADSRLLLQLHTLPAPALGANNLRVDLSDRANFVVGAIAMSGVNQSNPVEPLGANFATGSSNTSVLNINTTTNSAWVVDAFGALLQTATPAPDVSQTIQWSLRNNGGANRVWAASSSVGPVSPGSVPLGWSWAGAAATWIQGALAVRPAGTATAVLAWRESGL